MTRLPGAVPGAVAALGALAALVAAPPARAIERQHHLGLGPSLALLAIEDKSTLSVGGGGTLHYAYGLTDQWNLVGEGGSAVVAADQDQDSPESPRTRPARLDFASAGVGYVLDIIRWVPYLVALGGAHHLAGGTLDGSRLVPSAQLGVGLDYQLSRSWAVGVAGRQAFLLSDLSTYPSYTTATLRFEHVWGW